MPKNEEADLAAVEKPQLAARVLELLRSDVKAGRVAESYLFVGGDSAALRAAALELARAINCLGASADALDEPGLFGEEIAAVAEQTDELSCGLCAACRKISENIHPDVFVLDFESQGVLLGLKEEERARSKDLRIDAVRALLSRSVQSPVEARKRVFIIDGAECLNAESANALLKALEESSKNSHWILLSSAAERVLLTIQSRCRKVMVSAVGSNARERGEDGEGVSPLVEQALDFLLYKPAPQEIFGLASKILAEKKKNVNQRKTAEEFLRALARALSAHLHQQPRVATAQRLQSVLDAQSDLARNGNPQLILETLFLS